MRFSPVAVLAAAAVVVISSWPAEAQTRRGSRVEREPYPGAQVFRSSRPVARARITVRPGRTFLDPGTEVLPRSQSSLDYAIPPGWYATRIWDTTGAFRGPLAQPFELPNFP